MPFIAYPSAFLYSTATGKKKVEQYPWGYYVRKLPGAATEGRVQVACTWKDGATTRREAWIDEDSLQSDRPLEINFVDIGQGDGCFIVLPDDQRLLVDAGEGDNMYRFLRWRFRLWKDDNEPLYIDNAVITHPDKDHYYGFRDLAEDEEILFGNVFHNGIVERKGGPSLGPRTRKTADEESMLTDVIETPEQLDALLTPAHIGTKLYPRLLRSLLDLGRTQAVWMLHNEDAHLPGYGPGEDSTGVVIEVLAPVIERAPDGRCRLPWFSDDGKTKNGHSVVLRLRYGNLSVLLGGDLNIESEDYLLNRHTGLNPTPDNPTERQELIAAARTRFECDVMKACHHGSADFRATFLESVNPVAIVTSSGDDEPHSHPRPDALGAFGKYSRGRRPLIFSTELARSHKEMQSTPAAIQELIRKQLEITNASSSTPEDRRKAAQEIERLMERKERAVAVYGMITVTSDGQRTTVRQKLERPRSGTGEKWDIYRLEPGPDGRLRYESKYE